MDLIAFLAARLSEDEQQARAAKDIAAKRTHYRAAVTVRADRELREAEGKRRILDLHTASEEAQLEGRSNTITYCPICGNITFPCPTLRAVTLAYADHPYYDESWRP